jgi:hypothetical protein
LKKIWAKQTVCERLQQTSTQRFAATHQKIVSL